MTRNREQDVIDAIDALVDEQMAGGEHAHQERAQATGTSDRCTLCHGAWHGDPWTGVDHEHLGQYDQHHHGRTLGCPGANATGPQRIRWRHNRNHHRWPYTDMVTSTAWTVDLINAMRPPVPPWRQLLLNSIAATRGDIQLPNRPAFNPADWGLPPQHPYIEVASEPYIDRVNALRSPPNPLLPQPSSPWIIRHTSEGADPPSITHVIPPELTIRHQRPLADSPQWLQDLVDHTADWLADTFGLTPSPRWRNGVRAAVDGRPYVGHALHEGARIAVQLADGTLMTGVIGTYDQNEETGEIEMTVVQHPEYGFGSSALVVFDEPYELMAAQDPAEP